MGQGVRGFEPNETFRGGDGGERGIRTLDTL